MEDKQVDVVGWFKNVIITLKKSIINIFSVITEMKQLRKNLTKVSEHLDIFKGQVWMEKDILFFQCRTNKNYWIRLGALVFKVEDDQSTFRKWLLRGTKAVSSLYVISPPDCDVKIKTEIKRGLPPSSGWGFVLGKGGKLIKIDLKSDSKWWGSLVVETSKAMIHIEDELRRRKEKREQELEEARKIMDFNSVERNELLRLLKSKGVFK